MENNTSTNIDNNTSKTLDKTINKDNFNSMSIPEQIQIVNQFIKLGDSINKLAKMLGYNETTLRDRYKRAGYTRVTSRGIFVPNEELEQARAEEAKNREAKNKGANKTKSRATKKSLKDSQKEQSHKTIIKTSNKTIKEDKGAIKIMKTDNKSTKSDNIQGQENLLNTIELGDNIFNLLPAQQGVFSTALELNNAVKRNINIRTSKEVSRKLLSIYNFLSSVEPEAGDAINYTSIIAGALSIYFDKLQAEYGELFTSYTVEAEAETPNTNHHKAVAELLKLINEK